MALDDFMIDYNLSPALLDLGHQTAALEDHDKLAALSLLYQLEPLYQRDSVIKIVEKIAQRWGELKVKFINGPIGFTYSVGSYLASLLCDEFKFGLVFPTYQGLQAGRALGIVSLGLQLSEEDTQGLEAKMKEIVGDRLVSFTAESMEIDIGFYLSRLIILQRLIKARYRWCVRICAAVAA
jgi:hypothetical protein